MIRLLNAYFPKRTLLLGISEGCLIALSFVAAAVVRLGTNDATVMLHYEQGFLKILMLSGAFVICMYYFDLYDTSILSNRREVLSRLIQVLGTMCILLAVVYYLYPPLELGRGIILLGLLIVVIILALWRGLFAAVIRRPQFAERTMIFGDGPSASKLFQELDSRPELGISIVGRILVTGNGSYELNCEHHSPNGTSEGTITDEDLPTAIGLQRVSRIIVALDDRRGRLPVELLLSMKGRGVFIQDGTEYYEQVTGKLPIESLRLGTLLFSSGFHLSRFLRIYKRLASIVVSIVGLVLCLPFLPFVALAIKLSSPGPLLYHQKRVGRDDIIFYCHKFRTMRADAEAATGAVWASKDDPRVTPFGRTIRKLRIDEIPQLINVLKGEMSVVGPRPERPEMVQSLSEKIPYYRHRHCVRPGITGWAQVNYKYGDTLEDVIRKLEYDLYYIKNMSLSLDAYIIFLTVKAMLLSRGSQ